MKKQRVLPILELRDDLGRTLYKDRLDRLAVPDAIVVELSIHYFNDPDPCFIHQGAVLSRIFAELEATLTAQWQPLASIPAETARYLARYSVCEARLLMEENK